MRVDNDLGCLCVGGLDEEEIAAARGDLALREIDLALDGRVDFMAFLAFRLLSD